MVEHFFDTSKPMIPVMVTLNGKKGMVRVHGVVDTGSTFVGIPEEIAETLGYDKKKVKEKVKVATNSGMVQLPLITLDEVSVLNMTATRVKAVIIPFTEESRINCLIGLTFLRNFNIAIDYTTGSLTVEEG